MAQTPDQTKFEALIRNSLFDGVAEWVKHRGKPSNTQLGEAMFRLFLAAPNWIKLLAFIAASEDLGQLPETVWNEIVAALRGGKPPKAPAYSDKNLCEKYAAALEAFGAMPPEQRQTMPRPILELFGGAPTEEAKSQTKPGIPVVAIPTKK